MLAYLHYFFFFRFLKITDFIFAHVSSNVKSSLEILYKAIFLETSKKYYYKLKVLLYHINGSWSSLILEDMEELSLNWCCIMHSIFIDKFDVHN